MNSNTTGTQISAPALGLRVAIGATILAALIAVGMLAGCGNHESDTASAVGDGNTTVAVQSGEPIPAQAALSTPTTPEGGSHTVVLGDSLPPDVMASVEDSLVIPGDVVEITAQGSEDVSQIGLSDGLGRMQLFTREPASNVWHVLYRVPVGTRRERLALSVTALNDVNRWRRVWVFVSVQQKDGAVEPSGTGAATTPEGSDSHSSLETQSDSDEDAGGCGGGDAS